MRSLLCKKLYARFCSQEKQSKISNLQLLYQMSKQAKTPFFKTQSHHIEIIQDPLEFYLQLQTHVKKSVYRIGISSLYLGTGTLERHFFKNLVKRVKNTPSLEVCMLLDYHRSSRPQKGESSIEMMNGFLGGSLEKQRIKIAFHEQSKAANHIWGELKGVHHQKFAIFDDTIIIGGANLSQNYFLNRRDRYLKFKQCPELCDYLNDYLQIFYQNSYQLGETNNPIKPKSINLQKYFKMWKFAHSPDSYRQTLLEQEKHLDQLKQQEEYQTNRTIKDSSTNKRQNIPKNRNELISEVLGSDIQQYNEMESRKFEQLRDDVRSRLFETGDEDDVGNHLMQIQDIKTGKQVTQIGEKVYIFPFIQNKRILKENIEEKTTEEILKNSVQAKLPIKVSSGYLNFTPQILNVLGKATNPTQILCSAPEANSFYRAGRFKKYIPCFYRCFEGNIFEKYGHQKFKIKEFLDGKWSFHAKGMWIKQNQNNYLTIVGSSNFNHRSKERDSQLQLFVYSTCPAFNHRLDGEWEHIEKDCQEITLQKIKQDNDTVYNWKNKLLSKIFSGYL